MKEGEQDIEHGYHRSQACLDVGTESVMNPLEITDDSHHRQGRFDTQAFIPGAFGTQFAIVGNAVHTAEARVGQDNASLVHALNHVMEGLIVDIHGIPIPLHDLAVVIEQPAQLDADTESVLCLCLSCPPVVDYVLAEWERAIQLDNYRSP